MATNQDSTRDQVKLLTVPQVAEALSLSRTRLYELLSSGALVSVKIGRRRFIRRSDLETFVDNLEDAA